MNQRTFWTSVILCIFFIGYTANSQVTKTFKVTNKTGIPLKSVRCAKADTFEWGFELNVSDKIPLNGSFDFNTKIDTAFCKYDFKFTGVDDAEYILKKVDMCSSTKIELIMPEEKKEN